MRHRYPIRSHREFRSFPGRAALRRRRPAVAGPQEALVYRIGDQYVAGVAVDAPLAARAASVSVVDLRPDVILAARHVLPAAGSPLDFQVTVFFRATVVDPVAVVRARHTSAVRDPDGFLTSETGLLASLARAHPPGDEHGLHRAADALLESWATRAGTIPGLRVELARVNVLPATILDIDA